MKVWKWLLVSSLLCSVVSAAHAQTSPIINPISMSPTAPAVNGVVTFTVQVVGCGNPQAPCNPFSVSWSTTSKGGTLAAPTTSTNAGGLASNTMQLGPAAEAGITVTASIGDGVGQVATFGPFMSSASAGTPPVCTITAVPALTVLPGTPVTLTASCDQPNLTYLWSTGEKTQTITVGPTTTTTYTVTVTTSGGTQVTPPAVTVVVVQGSLRAVSGDNQQGQPGVPLQQPLVLQALLNNGQPIIGQTVTWTAIGNTGSFTQTSTITDGSGITSTQFTPGTETGVQTVRATLGSLSLDFVVRVAAPTACQIDAVPLPPIVLGGQTTLTANCLPVPNGAAYLWSPGGQNTQSISVSPTEATTYTVTVTLPNGFVTKSSITVTLNAGQLTIVSGDNQVALANTSLAAPLAVKVTGGNNAPTPGVVVTWTPAPGDVMGTPTSATDANGIARNTLKLGPVVGPRTVTASIPGGASVVFHVQSAEIAVVRPTQNLVTPLATMAIATPQAQLDELRRRMDARRLGPIAAGFANDLNVRVDGKPLPLGLIKSLFDDPPRRGGGASADDPELAQAAEIPKPPSGWGIFVNGEIDYDTQDPTGLLSGYKLKVREISFGADFLFPNKNLLGGSISFTKGDTNINGGGTQTGNGLSASVFGALVPFENAFVNGIFTYGHNRYKTNRLVGVDDYANGQTQGNQFALSLSAGYDIKAAPFTLSPYGRLDGIIATINGFSESGDNAIHVGYQRIDSLLASVGGLVSYTQPVPFGLVIPTFRVEWQHQAASSSMNVNAGLVADPLQQSFSVPISFGDKNFGNIGAGVLFTVGKNFSGFFNYESLFGKDNYKSNRYTLGIRIDL